ncbi:uncharacterized protein BDZ99DRAFT_495187 [Mytilinidion resinicola]|uniref:Uncharacterized protein n=1 Tax=Mytilinidion resinicola TaxID=574789 RepID=A0A6A6Z5F7_9PEZI|nr:uncharacterized protein BDZ99DRAFT_495187 [Mytilinidion resinicola]KAF2815425.1 hypothetical protein BDZ99DRAFT_495187 [Mytilinidion resinicola]
MPPLSSRSRRPADKPPGINENSVREKLEKLSVKNMEENPVGCKTSDHTIRPSPPTPRFPVPVVLAFRPCPSWRPDISDMIPWTGDEMGPTSHLWQSPLMGGKAASLRFLGETGCSHRVRRPCCVVKGRRRRKLGWWCWWWCKDGVGASEKKIWERCTPPKWRPPALEEARWVARPPASPCLGTPDQWAQGAPHQVRKIICEWARRSVGEDDVEERLVEASVVAVLRRRRPSTIWKLREAVEEMGPASTSRGIARLEGVAMPPPNLDQAM